ncbi:MAG: hypothetical protein ACJA1A_002016 [Saprospiraceae bacterium]|jgi:hypothetical protein
MKFIKLLFVVVVAFTINSSQAQTFGVRSGLNYSKFLGPSISADNATEKYGLSSGFHFGLSYAYDFTDIFSLRTELVYIQNGSTYEYDGDSYYIIRDLARSKTTIEKGDVDYDLNISNAYISIPIMANYRISNKWEIFAGPYVNLLIGPTGRGKLRFQSYENPDDIVFRQSLDFKYNSDAGAQIFGSSPQASDRIGIIVDGEVVDLERFAGAYTRQGERTGNKFNFLDIGLTAGAHYFLNKGFFVGFQIDYGLVDLTNNDVDFSLKDVNPDNSFQFSDDKDSHLGIHASFGFRF